MYMYVMSVCGPAQKRTRMAPKSFLHRHPKVPVADEASASESGASATSPSPTSARAKFVHQNTDAELEAKIKGTAPAPRPARMDSQALLASVQADGDNPPHAAAAAGTSGGRDQAMIAALRCCLMGMQAGSDAALAALREMQPVIGRSTRADFLRTLPELIGPHPEEHWHEEWSALSAEYLSEESDELEVGRQLAALSTEDQRDYIDNSPIYSAEALLRTNGGLINHLVNERGWERRHAETYTLLYPMRAPLSRALAARRGTYAASTYAISEALWASASCGAGQHVALYKHLHGPYGLIESDAAWANLLVPDRTGFRGLTSSALVVATCDPRCFTSAGFRNGTTDDDGAAQYVLMDSDVVCIEARRPDSTASHAPVMIREEAGALPPNTLFRLKRVVPAGQWSVRGVQIDSQPPHSSHQPRQTPHGAGKPTPPAGALADAGDAARGPEGSGGGRSDGGGRVETSPGKRRAASGAVTPSRSRAATARAAEVPTDVQPSRRLFVVSCTFRPPREIVSPSRIEGSANKLVGDVHTLIYASREA